MSDDLQLLHIFLDFSRRKLLQEFWPRIGQCLDRLTEDQIWWRPQETSNSIGNLLLHLNGNVRQWILAPLGGLSHQRNRAAEFAERQPIASRALRDQLEATLREMDQILREIEPMTLQRIHTIQNYENITGLEAIYHVVEHFGFHYGQIVYITKLLTGHDLGFYRHLDEQK